MTDTHALYTVKEIRQVEQEALANSPSYALMQRAGTAAGELAYELLQSSEKEKRVLVLAGPGNNGGDALEAASQLMNAGLKVCITLPYASDHLTACLLYTSPSPRDS